MTTLTATQMTTLRAELYREDLAIYTVVVMARRDLEQGNIETALSRLRVDADKILMHSPPLYDLLANYARPTEKEKTMTLTDHQVRAVASAFAMLNSVTAKLNAKSIEFSGGEFIMFVQDGSLYVGRDDTITEDFDSLSDFLAAYGLLPVKGKSYVHLGRKTV